MKYDIIVLGSGSAGLSAAVTARGRNKSVLVIGNRWQDSPLARAERVDNYLGMPGMTGMEMLEAFQRHAQEMGVEMVTGKVLSIMEWEGFHLTVGSQLYQGSALILAPGVVRQAKFPGEETYLGRGVSYCATCDGMLYRGRTVAAIGSGEEFEKDVRFLEDIGCTVLKFNGGRFEIEGGEKVELLRHEGEEYPVECVFILKSTVSVGSMLPGVKTEGGRIVADEKCATNIAGLFAAGDCTGAPYQIAKAVGEGNIAALSACEYLDKK